MLGNDLVRLARLLGFLKKSLDLIRCATMSQTAERSESPNHDFVRCGSRGSNAPGRESRYVKFMVGT
jgi:hypothetical protein